MTNNERGVAAHIAAQAVHEAAPVGKRQYFYRMTGCNAGGADDSDCICWHDEGTGPLVDEPDMIRSWREAPTAIDAEQVIAMSVGNTAKRIAGMEADKEFTEGRAAWRKLDDTTDGRVECSTYVRSLSLPANESSGLIGFNGVMPVGAFVIMGQDNKPMVTIRRDATIKLGEGVELESAAREFWIAVNKMGFALAPRVADAVAPARAAEILSHDELITLYNTMDGAAIIADKQPGDHGNLILEAYARRVIAAAVEKAAKVAA